MPEPLRLASNEAFGKYQAQKGIAAANLLDVRKGYAGNNAQWTADTITPTRLGEKVTVFRLGRIVDGGIVPWCLAEDGDPRRSWALSEVSLNHNKASGVPKHDPATEGMIAIAKASWSQWEQEQPLLILYGEDEGATGTVLDKTGRPQPVVYGRQTTGLWISKKN